MNQFGGVDSFTSNESPIFFHSDQGTESFDSSDFSWEEQAAKTPEISSVISALSEVDEPLFVEIGNPKKKLKSDSEDVSVVEENDEKYLSEELLAFDNQTNFQMPYSDGSWEASFDSFLSGDATLDAGNSMDFWSFGDLATMVEGVY
uniref:Ethylene-responsive transcription factor n=1 Tax=Rhizophora mucronata TaxID=61149 RepID=A0A2P2JFU7_RHIMU